LNHGLKRIGHESADDESLLEFNVDYIGYREAFQAFSLAPIYVGCGVHCKPCFILPFTATRIFHCRSSSILRSLFEHSE